MSLCGRMERNNKCPYCNKQTLLDTPAAPMLHRDPDQQPQATPTLPTVPISQIDQDKQLIQPRQSEQPQAPILRKRTKASSKKGKEQSGSQCKQKLAGQQQQQQMLQFFNTWYAIPVVVSRCVFLKCFLCVLKEAVSNNRLDYVISLCSLTGNNRWDSPRRPCHIQPLLLHQLLLLWLLKRLDLFHPVQAPLLSWPPRTLDCINITLPSTELVRVCSVCTRGHRL